MSAPVWRWVFSRPAVPPSEPAWCSDNQPDLPRPLSAGPAGQPLLPGPHLPGRGGEVPGGGRHQDNTPQVWLLWLMSLLFTSSDSWTTNQSQNISQVNRRQLKKLRKPEVKFDFVLAGPSWFCFLLITSNLLLLKLRVLCIQDLINNFSVWNHKVPFSSYLNEKTKTKHWAGG